MLYKFSYMLKQLVFQYKNTYYNLIIIGIRYIILSKLNT